MLERAELLRGPASVLYGLSEPGGVIALVSKRPTPQTIREVQFKTGNHNLSRRALILAARLMMTRN